MRSERGLGLDRPGLWRHPGAGLGLVLDTHLRLYLARALDTKAG